MTTLSRHSIECNLMVMGEERNGCNCGAEKVWGGCSHQDPTLVEKRWAQYRAMPRVRTDVGICECCGGPALLGEIRETVISWLNDEGNHESSMVEIAQEVECSHCKEGQGA